MTIWSLFSAAVATSTLLLGVNSLSIGHHRSFTRTATKISMWATDTNSWANLQSAASQTRVGAALDLESESRINGTGAPFVQNKLRLFGSNERPKITLYRDHAGKFGT
jgi:hypothetical protein